MNRKLGPLLLGMIAGALLVHLCHARRLEELYWHRERLKTELFEITERLARSESLWADRPEERISAVNLVFQGIDGFVQLELQRLIGELTAGLIGSTIEELRPELVVALLHRRKFTVEGRDYLVTVNWAVIAPQTIFNLSVAPAPAGG